MLERTAAGVRALVWGVALGYPVAMYWAFTNYGSAGGAWVGLGSAVIWALRAALSSPAADRRSLWMVPLVVAGLSALTFALDDERLLLGLPVLINLVLLTVFVGSLRQEQTYVERIARLFEPELTPAKVSHCRQFTWVWVGFFVVNGSITAALALRGSLEAWTLYTSFVSYLLMALLFLVEWLVRRARFGTGTQRELQS